MTRALRDLSIFNDESDDFVPELVVEKARLFRIDETALMAATIKMRREHKKEMEGRKVCPCCGREIS